MTPMARRHVAVVTYYFPPATAIGAHRWASMARHLRALGHDVSVVTSVIHGSLPDDGERVLRTGDLGNAAALRRLLRRPALATAGAPALTPAPAVLTHVVPPDSYLVSWVPSALAAVVRLARRRPIDCIVTSGPPDSAHLLPLLLGRRRPPWIADFRDGWRFEPLREEPWPTRAQERLDAWLERHVARAAEVVIGATAPIADDFRARLGADAHWVSNGFDPAATVAEADSTPGEPGWLTLVHTGTLSGPRGRDPRPFLAALQAFNTGREAGAPGIRLVLAGRPSVEDEALIARASLDSEVQHVGLLDRPAALALQRSADGLLLLTGTHRSEATGKLFEYLAAGRPILALAQENEAARIVRETGTGVTVPGTDPGALQAALQALADGSLARGYAPRGLERYRYPGPAATVSELIERARSKRNAHRP